MERVDKEPVLTHEEVNLAFNLGNHVPDSIS